MTDFSDTRAADIERRFREIAVLESLCDLADWDEQTQLPPGGAEYRAAQVEFLAGEIHRRSTAPEVVETLDHLLEGLGDHDPHSPQATNIRRLHKRVHKQARLPARLVEELARVTTLGQQVWSRARIDDDYARFEPYLKQVVALKREAAACLGGGEVPYDALLDDYEPDTLTRHVTSVLEALRRELVPLVQAISEASQRPDTSLVERPFPRATQEAFARQAAGAIGFDFSAGRIDVSAHPFCTTLGPRDIRLTTRYQDHHFNDAFFSVLHEAGHGLYEQGLPDAWYGLPAGQSVSLGIHESQSRMWENLVGRSLSFWEHFFPQAQQLFPESLGGESLPAFYGAINAVSPSLIRTDADEVTYNLHVLIRFEIEQQLIDGTLEVADVRTAWAEGYEKMLGIQVPSDRDGCLQDIHWARGHLGYFSTYALGNLYAAQLFEAAERDLGDLPSMFRAGEFAPLLEWLRTHIHRHGQCYSPGELVTRATGSPLSHEALMRYLRAKYTPIYGLDG